MWPNEHLKVIVFGVTVHEEDTLAESGVPRRGGSDCQQASPWSGPGLAWRSPTWVGGCECPAALAHAPDRWDR